MNSKENLRQIYKQKRKLLCENGQLDIISKKISEKICENEYFKKAHDVLIFYPMYFELNILSILTQDKRFYLPVCKNGEIEVCPYKKGDELKANNFNILEPLSAAIDDIGILDVVITPALCADKSLFRLGFGGGYYDKFFSRKEMRAAKILIVPDEMVLEQLPLEEFDIGCDVLITEKRIIEK